MQPPHRPTAAGGSPGIGPTTATPGSPEKIAVLRARFARREPLFHPLDAAGSQPPPRPDRAPSTLPPGVRWDGRNGRFRAKAWSKSRQRSCHLGLFDTVAEAKLAVEKFRREERRQGAGG